MAVHKNDIRFTVTDRTIIGLYMQSIIIYNNFYIIIPGGGSFEILFFLYRLELPETHDTYCCLAG